MHILSRSSGSLTKHWHLRSAALSWIQKLRPPARLLARAASRSHSVCQNRQIWEVSCEPSTRWHITEVPCFLNVKVCGMSYLLIYLGHVGEQCFCKAGNWGRGKHKWGCKEGPQWVSLKGPSSVHLSSTGLPGQHPSLLIAATHPGHSETPCFVTDQSDVSLLSCRIFSLITE